MQPGEPGWGRSIDRLIGARTGLPTLTFSRWMASKGAPRNQPDQKRSGEYTWEVHGMCVCVCVFRFDGAPPTPGARTHPLEALQRVNQAGQGLRRRQRALRRLAAWLEARVDDARQEDVKGHLDARPQTEEEPQGPRRQEEVRAADRRPRRGDGRRRCCASHRRLGYSVEWSDLTRRVRLKPGWPSFHGTRPLTP